MRAPVLSLAVLATAASTASATEEDYFNYGDMTEWDATDPRRNAPDGSAENGADPSDCPERVTGMNSGREYNLFGQNERTVTLNGTATVNAQFGFAGGSAEVGYSSTVTFNEGTYIAADGTRINVNCGTGLVTGRIV
jgi:hypothetical protein